MNETKLPTKMTMKFSLYLVLNLIAKCLSKDFSINKEKSLTLPNAGEVPQMEWCNLKSVIL